MLKALATWELQKGTTIGRVEQLVGSHTLVGSLVTQIELRTFNLIAMSIVALWALSPVGSQASLRIAYIKSVPIDTQNQLTFSEYSSFSSPRVAEQTFLLPYCDHLLRTLGAI